MKKLYLLLFGVVFFAVSAMAQRTITGKVTDENGNPVADASIIVKGTTVGTTSNSTGTFSINVPANGKTLLITSIGKTAQEVAIGNGNTYAVSLVSTSTELGEVVVVGYGSAKKKENVAGSLTKISGEVVHDKPTANMLDAMQGKVAGLQIYNSSGEPSNTPSARLHGVGSLGASNTPLYVLDGVPVGSGSIISLNPNDIESITVLKDPSTTAIYGARASNGVILYTTKQGKLNSSRLTISSQYGVSNLLKSTKDMFNSFMNRKQLSDFFVAVGQRTQAQMDATLAQYPNFDTKWYKSYYQEDIPTYQVDMNMSGGGGKTTYYVSGGYFKQEGLAYRSAYERYTFRSNIQSTVNNWFKFGMNLSGGLDKRQTNPYGSNSTNRGLALLAAPWFSPVDANGVEYPDLIPGWARYNPKYLANKIQGLDKNVQFNPTLYAELSPIKGLILRTQGGMDWFDYTSTAIQYPSYLGSLNNGSVSETFQRGTVNTITNTAEYKFKVKGNHEFTALAGQEYIYSITKSFVASSTGQTDDRLVTVSAGTVKNSTSSITEYAYQSFFGRLNYNYKAKYFVDVSARQDQSSRFGKDNRTANFWSAGVLWKAKKEKFLADVNWLTDLSVRASYGTSGNSSIGNYDNLATVGTGQYDGQTSFGINTAGNPQLGWESQKQTTIGFDAVFLKRINLKLDYYIRNTSDQLFSVPFPYTSGFANVLDNVGSIKNSGIDLEFSATVYKTKNAYITPFAALNFNKNEVTELFQGKNYWVIPNTGVSYVIGQPVSFLYPIWAGVNPTTGMPEWYLPNADPEKFMYKNTDKSQVTTVFNSTTLQQGTGIQRYAPFNGGFGVDAGFKGIYLNANFSFSQGKYLINNDAYFFENPNQFTGFNQSTAVLDYWKQAGDVTRFPKYGQQFTQFDSRLIQNASFVRLKGLTIGYALQKSLLNKLKVLKGADFSITGRNLWTATKYPGPDPEVDSNLSLGANPNTKQIVVGLKLEF